MSRFSVADYVENKLPIICMAHRGFSGRFPENTLIAFDKAIRAGADVIEFDVQQTADNQLIVYHDKTLLKFLRTADIVSQLTLKEIQSIDVGMQQSIPTLEQLFSECAGRVGMNIHVKMPGDIFDRVIEMCAQANILDEIFLAVEWKEEIVRLKKAYPKIWICSLFSRNSDGIVDSNRDLGIQMLQPTVEVLARNGREIVNRARDAGMIMGVFYADCFSHFQWLKRLGVGGILTNHPDVFFECFEQRNAQ